MGAGTDTHSQTGCGESLHWSLHWGPPLRAWGERKERLQNPEGVEGTRRTRPTESIKQGSQRLTETRTASMRPARVCTRSSARVLWCIVGVNELSSHPSVHTSQGLLIVLVKYSKCSDPFVLSSLYTSHYLLSLMEWKQSEEQSTARSAATETVFLSDFLGRKLNRCREIWTLMVLLSVTTDNTHSPSAASL